MGATCKGCGLKFGCGCQLTNGLCSACYALFTKGKQKFKNVIFKTCGLCGMF